MGRFAYTATVLAAFFASLGLIFGTEDRAAQKVGVAIMFFCLIYFLGNYDESQKQEPKEPNSTGPECGARGHVKRCKHCGTPRFECACGQPGCLYRPRDCPLCGR